MKNRSTIIILSFLLVLFSKAQTPYEDEQRLKKTLFENGYDYFGGAILDSSGLYMDSVKIDGITLTSSMSREFFEEIHKPVVLDERDKLKWNPVEYEKDKYYSGKKTEKPIVESREKAFPKLICLLGIVLVSVFLFFIKTIISKTCKTMIAVLQKRLKSFKKYLKEVHIKDRIKAYLKNCSQKEIIIISVIFGVLVFLVLGIVFGERVYMDKGVQVWYKNGSIEKFDFNYLVAIIGLIVSSGSLYLFLYNKFISKKT